MSEKKQGFVSTMFKIIMVTIFALIGAGLITIGAICIAKNWDGNLRWLSICNIVFGSLLFTSPFFLKKDIEGIAKIIKIIMIIIFTLIGVLLVIGGSLALAHVQGVITITAPNWFSICNIVFGALLLTAPIFLKN